jgi:anti-sigma B factor antagonist
MDPLTSWDPSKRLKLERVTEGTDVVLKLEGEVDLETVGLLDEQILLITAAGPPRLLIDLSGVEFIDSTGLSAILKAHQGALTGGHDFSLRGGSKQVKRLFELTGLLDRLNFED